MKIGDDTDINMADAFTSIIGPLLDQEARPIALIETLADGACQCARNPTCRHSFQCACCGIDVGQLHTPTCSFAFLNARPWAQLEADADAALLAHKREAEKHAANSRDALRGMAIMHISRDH
jgi:hypothetical protein